MAHSNTVQIIERFFRIMVFDSFDPTGLRAVL
jgi:hypothetical protein